MIRSVRLRVCKCGLIKRTIEVRSEIGGLLFNKDLKRADDLWFVRRNPSEKE